MRSDVPGTPRDPGLQAERTALAWNRTAIAVVANALLALRAGLIQQRMIVVALGIALLLCAGALTMFGWARRKHLLGQDQLFSPSPAMVAAATVFAMTCSLVALATVKV